jgi:glycosyltransferase involved in cell wall biosynthesis
LDLLAEAALEVPPDDIEAYAAAVRRLADDEELYEAKRLACLRASGPFLDEDESWGRKLQLILHDMLQENT